MYFSGNGTEVNQSVGGSFSVILTSDRITQQLTTSELEFTSEWSCKHENIKFIFRIITI